MTMTMTITMNTKTGKIRATDKEREVGRGRRYQCLHQQCEAVLGDERDPTSKTPNRLHRLIADATQPQGERQPYWGVTAPIVALQRADARELDRERTLLGGAADRDDKAAVPSLPILAVETLGCARGTREERCQDGELPRFQERPSIGGPC